MELNLRDKELFGKCGIFCGACIVHLGMLSNPGKEMRTSLDRLNFSDAAHLVTSKEKYATFREILDYFCDGFVCKGCGAKNTVLDCPIRKCCEEKAIFSCAECQEFKDTILTRGLCSNDFMHQITKRYSNWNIDNLKKINEIGYEKFFQQMNAEVAKGFCTGEVISKQPAFGSLKTVSKS